MKKQKKRNTKKYKKRINGRNNNGNFELKETLVKKQTDYILKLYSKIVQTDYFNCGNRLIEGRDVKFIPSYKSLPFDVVKKIDNQINNYPIRNKFCINNSTQVGLTIPGVKIVHGFYKYNLYSLRDRMESIENKQFYNEVIKDVKSYKDEWIRYKWGDYTTELFYVNPETCDYWMRHVWNKYENVHFDLSVEFSRMNNLDDFKRWVNYKEVKTLNPSELINLNLLKNMKLDFNRLISFISGSTTKIGNLNNEVTEELYPILSTSKIH